MSQEAKSLLTGLLSKLPYKRIGAGGMSEVKSHPFFSSIDWDEVMKCEHEAPWKPEVETPSDVRNFDEFFTRERNVNSVSGQEEAPKIPWISSFDFNSENNKSNLNDL